jgi:hypothetical protein
MGVGIASFRNRILGALAAGQTSLWDFKRVLAMVGELGQIGTTDPYLCFRHCVRTGQPDDEGG